MKLPPTMQMQLYRWSFNESVRQSTWQKLAELLKHDVPLEYALKVMRDRCLERKEQMLAGVFSQVLKEINKGHSPDIAFKKFIPAEEAMLIHGGYLATNVGESLELCAKLITARKTIKSAVIGAVAYPIFLMVMIIVLLVVISFHIMPTLSDLIDPSLFTGFAAILYHVSNFVSSTYGLISLVVLLCTMVLIFTTLPIWRGKTRLWVENLPPWSIYRLIMGTMWLFTVATSLRANVSLDHTLDAMLKGDISPWLRERVVAIRKQYMQGKNAKGFGRVLADTGLQFPDPTMVDDILIYSTLPTFENILHQLADQWLTNGIQRIKSLSGVVNTGFLIGVIGIMCGISLAVVSIQQQLSSALGAM